jgi:hypothetical protein
MKSIVVISVVFSLSLGLVAQSRTAVASGSPAQPATPGQSPASTLNGILADLQRTTQTTNLDLSKLRIEKWKVDDSERQQLQQVAESLQKNITTALPGLITELQAAPGSVSKAFKLYHDLNVVYEFLNSLAEAAGAYGKKEEYTALANDASSLDTARASLSTYIELAANALENPVRAKSGDQQQVQAGQATKKIVVDDDAPPRARTKKKKTSVASTPPSSSSSSSSSPPQR